MADPRDTSIPDEQPPRDPEKGSRESVNTDVEPSQANRPIEEEQRDQQNLPPRGTNRGDAERNPGT